MKTSQLLIATHNPAKKQELREGFLTLLSNGNAWELLSLDDLHISADLEETGKTFFDNAQLKAKYFAQISGVPTVADDGGIEIDALLGEPGVHSKRWLGYDATDDEMIAYTLRKLEAIPQEKRKAHLTVCLYYINPLTGFETSVTESIEGEIALSPSSNAIHGFPYRALFIVSKYGKYYDELSRLEHDSINHRLRAVKKLCPIIEKDLYATCSM